MSNDSDLAKALMDASRKAEKYQPCMSLHVSEDGAYVDLILDTGVSTYSEWIPGEGGDIALTRCQETGRVVGCHLPLMRSNLAVFHEGPLRINDGFLKEGCNDQ